MKLKKGFFLPREHTPSGCTPPKFLYIKVAGENAQAYSYVQSRTESGSLILNDDGEPTWSSVPTGTIKKGEVLGIYINKPNASDTDIIIKATCAVNVQETKDGVSWHCTVDMAAEIAAIRKEASEEWALAAHNQGVGHEAVARRLDDLADLLFNLLDK